MSDVDSDDLETPYAENLLPNDYFGEFLSDDKPREPLRPGDVIEYTCPMYVRGDRRGRRITTVVSTDPCSSGKMLCLQNGDCLPNDTLVKRVQVLEHGKLYKHTHGFCREIQDYKMEKRGSAVVNGIREEAKRVGDILDRNLSKFATQAKQDGFAPMDLFHKRSKSTAASQSRVTTATAAAALDSDSEVSSEVSLGRSSKSRTKTNAKKRGGVISNTSLVGAALDSDSEVSEEVSLGRGTKNWALDRTKTNAKKRGSVVISNTSLVGAALDSDSEVSEEVSLGRGTKNLVSDRTKVNGKKSGGVVANKSLVALDSDSEVSREMSLGMDSKSRALDRTKANAKTSGLSVLERLGSDSDSDVSREALLNTRTKPRGIDKSDSTAKKKRAASKKRKRQSLDRFKPAALEITTTAKKNTVVTLDGDSESDVSCEASFGARTSDPSRTLDRKKSAAKKKGTKKDSAVALAADSDSDVSSDELLVGRTSYQKRTLKGGLPVSKKERFVQGDSETDSERTSQALACIPKNGHSGASTSGVHKSKASEKAPHSASSPFSSKKNSASSKSRATRGTTFSSGQMSDSSVDSVLGRSPTTSRLSSRTHKTVPQQPKSLERSPVIDLINPKTKTTKRTPKAGTRNREPVSAGSAGLAKFNRTSAKRSGPDTLSFQSSDDSSDEERTPVKNRSKDVLSGGSAREKSEPKRNRSRDELAQGTARSTIPSHRLEKEHDSDSSSSISFSSPFAQRDAPKPGLDLSKDDSSDDESKGLRGKKGVLPVVSDAKSPVVDLTATDSDTAADRENRIPVSRSRRPRQPDRNKICTTEPQWLEKRPKPSTATAGIAKPSSTFGLSFTKRNVKGHAGAKSPGLKQTAASIISRPLALQNSPMSGDDDDIVDSASKRARKTSKFDQHRGSSPARGMQSGSHNACSTIVQSPKPGYNSDDELVDSDDAENSSQLPRKRLFTSSEKKHVAIPGVPIVKRHQDSSNRKRSKEKAYKFGRR